MSAEERQNNKNIPSPLTRLGHTTGIFTLPSLDWVIQREHSLFPHAIGSHNRHIPSPLTRLGHTTGAFPLPSLDWVIQRERRSSAHHLRPLRCARGTPGKCVLITKTDQKHRCAPAAWTSRLVACFVRLASIDLAALEGHPVTLSSHLCHIFVSPGARASHLRHTGLACVAFVSHRARVRRIRVTTLSHSRRICVTPGSRAPHFSSSKPPHPLRPHSTGKLVRHSTQHTTAPVCHNLGRIGDICVELRRCVIS
eukprot:1179793-Prorocentrum_minimum.AAC.1